MLLPVHWQRSGEKHLGVPVVVENKPGGTGAVGLGETVKAKPDGYTLAVLPVELSFLKDSGIYPFDFTNFTRIMNLNTDPSALTVKADAPWNTLAGVRRLMLKANPGSDQDRSLRNRYAVAPRSCIPRACRLGLSTPMFRSTELQTLSQVSLVTTSMQSQ